MLGLLRSWAGALLVWIVGTSVMAALTPSVAPGNSIPVSDQALRIHLPWLVISAVLVPVAGILYWQPPSTRRLLLATLPVPALAIVIGAVAGLAGATSAFAALLYVGEGILGTALGFLIARLFARGDEPAEYPYPG